MRPHARMGAGVAGRRDRAHAFQERQRLVGNRDRVPAQRRDRDIDFVRRRGAPQPGVHLLESAPVPHGRADPIEPGALVAGPGRREGRAAELLGVEPVAALLGGVAADRQRARQSLGLEAVAEAGHVAGRKRALTGARLSAGNSRRVLDVHDHGLLDVRSSIAAALLGWRRSVPMRRA